MKNNNFSLSPNLIDQLQILLKNEAGFESFNFNNPSLNTPSSSPSSLLTEAIAGSNLSSDAVRCKDCNGELLRGPDSIICVYCGCVPQYNCIHNPISFKDCLAFQWLLKALDLDGFERVGVPVRGDGFGDRGRGSVKEEEMALSDLLDLELKWQDESREFGVEAEERGLGKRYLSLVGVDVEEILAQERVDLGFNVRDEQTVTSQKDENEGRGNSGDRSLSLFENTQTMEAALRLGEGEGEGEGEDEGGDEEWFSDWGADFQSATPSGSNLTDSSNNLSESGPPLNPNESDGNTFVEGGGKAIESVDSSFDWLPADQQPTAKEDSDNAEKRHGDDSFVEWGDFRMLTEPSNAPVLGNDSSGGLVTSDPFDDYSGFVASKDIQLPNNSFKVPDDGWNNFATPSTGGDIQSQAITDKPEEHVGTADQELGGEIDFAPLDVTYLEHQGIDVDRIQDKISDQGYSIGLWSNDIHLGIKGELDQLQGRDSKLPASGTSNEHSNSFDVWNDFKGLDNQQQATNREVADNKKSTQDVISFDVWNDFAGLGVRKKEEQSGSLEVVDGKGREGKDHSIDTWSDFAGTNGVFDSKPISNNISSEAWNDFSSVITCHADQPQIRNTRTSEDQAVLKDDDLFSSWGDLRSSGTQIGNSSLGQNDNKTSSDQISFHNAPNSLIKVEDKSTFSSWGDFGGTASLLGQSLQAVGAGSSENKLSSADCDLFPGFSNSGKQFSSQPDNQVQCDGLTLHNGESTLENDDSFDAWSDFTSSSNVQTTLSSVNALHDKEVVKHSDLFDAWNLIASSPNVQVGKDTAVAKVKTPELNYFSPKTNLQYVGPNSLMPLDPDVGEISHLNGSAPVPFSPPEGPDLVGTEYGDVKADCYVDGMNPSVSTSEEALDLKSSVAETLISEMHDLSFMLESTLSIPNSGK